MARERQQWPPPPEDGKGIECPDCGCRHFFTLSTRPTTGGRTIRRRECRHCGRRMTTYERAAGATETERQGDEGQ